MPLEREEVFVPYSSFQRRTFAAAIDLGLLSLSQVILLLLPFYTLLIIFPLTWLYFAVAESSEWEATIGKRFLSLKVTDTNGRRITLQRASIRYFCKYISLFLLLIGYFIAAFTPKRQALHDLACHTLVVKRD